MKKNSGILLIGIIIGIVVIVFGAIFIAANSSRKEEQRVKDAFAGIMTFEEESSESESVNTNSISGFDQNTKKEKLYAAVSGSIDQALAEMGANDSLKNMDAEFEIQDYNSDGVVEADYIIIYGTVDNVDIEAVCLETSPDIGWHLVYIESADGKKTFWDGNSGLRDIYDLHTGELVRPATKDVE